jgi:hypothetical protein
MNEENTKDFFRSAGAMVGDLLEEMKIESPEGYAGVSAALSRGAFFRLQVGVGAAGVIDTSLWLVDTGGSTVELFSMVPR